MFQKFKYLIIISLTLSAGINADAITGKWRGDIKMGFTKLPLVFDFTNSEVEKKATMDSPNQNVNNIPLEVSFSSADSISLTCNMINATYTGNLKNGVIKGTYTQNGYKLPLTLKPEKDISERRPQTPKAPYPYISKDTVFTSTDGTELAGTLVIPYDAQSKGCPIVIMLTGSGPQNRDEEMFEHRPFAVIADYLARNGIASFRFDDRGTAASKGDFTAATIPTFVEDAKSAFRFVKGLSGFGKAGLLGHSEGGTIAVLIANDVKPDFIVSLAGMVVPAKETMLAQNVHSLEKLGITGKQKEDSEKFISLLFDTIIGQYHSGTTSTIDVEKLCKENSFDVPPMVYESIKRNNAARNGYFDSLVSLDPTVSLKKIKCPVLAINGTKDTQVDASANLGAFSKYVKKAEIKSMNGLNHLMQHARSGEVSEYGDITETISPEVLDLISNFILKLR